MAFKNMEEINNQRYGHVFRLVDDKDWAKVVPLYKDYSDVILIDCHYINTDEYKGYVHCLEDGCPACQRGVPLKHKLFIPFLVLSDLNDKDQYPEDTVVFWDRNSSFDYQLQRDFFKKSKNPSELVFEIVRHGEYKDINTTYSINPSMRFGDDLDAKLKSMGVEFPDYYNYICKEYDSTKLSEILASSNSNNSIENLPTATLNYEVKPRTVVDPSTIVEDLPMSSDDLPVLTLDEVVGTVKAEEPIPFEVVNEEISETEPQTEIDIDSEPTF